MKTTTQPRNIIAMAAPVAIALALAACGGEKQMHTVAPTTAPVSLGATNMQPATIPNTPTASNVSISEEVLRSVSLEPMPSRRT
jgi:hypothetical protein